MSVVLNVDDIRSLAKIIATANASIEEDFKRGCLGALEACGVEGGQKGKEIEQLREAVEARINKISAWVESVKIAVIDIAKDIEGFDAQKEFQMAADAVASSKDPQNVETVKVFSV